MRIICSGHTARVGQVLQKELLCEIQDETEVHTARSSTLTSNHAMETMGERCQNMHATKVSLRQNPGVHKLGLGFPPPQYFTSLPFALLQPHQGLVAYAAPITSSFCLRCFNVHLFILKLRHN